MKKLLSLGGTLVKGGIFFLTPACSFRSNSRKGSTNHSTPQ